MLKSILGQANSLSTQHVSTVYGPMTSDLHLILISDIVKQLFVFHSHFPGFSHTCLHTQTQT